ncbi:MAG: hypothetical protein HKN37_10175 [Rhodothermales bacterium]|nr:hypothetical protein [Rhodothermales bacterium]
MNDELRTVNVTGRSIRWPAGCTCCGAETNAYKKVSRAFESSDLHAPVETKITVTTDVRIPVCDVCLRHIAGSESFELGCVTGGIMVALASGGFYALLITRYRSAVADLFGIAARNAFIPVSIMTLFFLALGLGAVALIVTRYYERASQVTPRCIHPDGGVHLTGFVAPTRIDPDIVETHRFTFKRLSLRDAFLAANSDHAHLAPETDLR